jgi:heme/copper-type cytochrome/quinol oxidase subunit 2
MQPIINPWLFYLVDFVGNLEVILWALFIVLVLVAVTALIIWTYIADGNTYNSEKEDEAAKKRFIKMFKTTLIPIALTAILIALTPSAKTIYTMIIVDNITPNNLATVGDSVQDTVDYIVDKVDQLLDKDKDSSDSSDEEDKE